MAVAHFVRLHSRSFTVYKSIIQRKTFDNFVKPFCTFRPSSTAKEGKSALGLLAFVRFGIPFRNFILKFLLSIWVKCTTTGLRCSRVKGNYISGHRVYKRVQLRQIIFILSTDSDYLLNLCNKQVQYLTISPAQSTSAWGHFRKMLDSAPLALRVPLLQARSHSDR